VGEQGACRGGRGLKERAARPIGLTAEVSVLVIVGSLVVVFAVAGGYLWHGGHLLLLNQPAEFVIIGGSAIGILIISTPMSIMHELIHQCRRLFSAAPGRQDFSDVLAMLYQLFRVVQSTGAMALETHFDDPKQSPILSRYPSFLARTPSYNFLADSARVIIVGGITPHDLDHLMTEDLELRHRQNLLPSSTMHKVADALPGLGIVAAVLGVVITMQAIDGPPSEIGHKVGAALVGTFLGILLSYGFVQPVAVTLEHRVNDEMNIDLCIKAGLLAGYKGMAPAIAVEFARRVIPDECRPSFEETEALCRGVRSDAQAAQAA
jgi:chemotaxis protein MotA